MGVHTRGSMKHEWKRQAWDAMNRSCQICGVVSGDVRKYSTGLVYVQQCRDEAACADRIAARESRLAAPEEEPRCQT